jgi:hypothetical protein
MHGFASGVLSREEHERLANWAVGWTDVEILQPSSSDGLRNDKSSRKKKEWRGHIWSGKLYIP